MYVVPELTRSKMKVRNFHILCVHNRVILGHVIALNQAAYIWLSDANSGERGMTNLSMAMATRYHAVPLAITLLADHGDDCGQNTGIKLSKKLNMQVLISSSLGPEYDDCVAQIEESLSNILRECQ